MQIYMDIYVCILKDTNTYININTHTSLIHLPFQLHVTHVKLSALSKFSDELSARVNLKSVYEFDNVFAAEL